MFIHTSFLASGAGADREGAVQRAADGESAARRREEGIRGSLRRRGQRGRRGRIAQGNRGARQVFFCSINHHFKLICLFKLLCVCTG